MGFRYFLSNVSGTIGRSCPDNPGNLKAALRTFLNCFNVRTLDFHLVVLVDFNNQNLFLDIRDRAVNPAPGQHPVPALDAVEHLLPLLFLFSLGINHQEIKQHHNGQKRRKG